MHEIGRARGDIRLLTKEEEYFLAMPEHDPDRNRDDNGRPHALTHGTAHIAHRMTVPAKCNGDHRHHSRNQPHREDHQGVIETRRQERRSQRVLAKTANEDHIGRSQCCL
ncbi:hypothetical protein FQZ97_1037460 [compost metagenome]